MKFAIIDDNLKDREYVEHLLEFWHKERDIVIKIETYSSAESFLFSYEEDNTCDVLLLDIEMGAMDGVTLAKKIRSKNKIVQIVFITGYSDYILDGYDVSALHYLMKPIKKEKFFEVMDKAYSKIKQNEKCLDLSISGELTRIPLHEIKYIEVLSNYVTIHGEQNYTLKKTLSSFVHILDDRFLKIGRSFIVNLTCIRRVTKTDIYLISNETIPLPRGAYESVNRAIIDRT